MAWERRGRRRYYTRSRRENGRIVREYVGRGLVGETAALEDEQAREERRATREAQLAEQEAANAAAAALAALDEAIRHSARRTLEAEGFHEHRGVWRRRRGHGRAT